MRVGAAALLLAAALPASAQLYPPASPGLAPRGTAVFDRHGRRADLAGFLAGPGPVILLPIFTRCGGTCPTLAGSLKGALAREHDVPFRVVVFSFDASDRDADLESFRKDLALPDDWTFLRAADEGGARAFLDQFGYAVLQRNRMFIHPSEMFVLSARGRWSGTFAGGVFPLGSVGAAARQAEDLESPSPWRRWRRTLAMPQVWSVLALAGLIAVTAGALILSTRRKPS